MNQETSSNHWKKQSGPGWRSRDVEQMYEKFSPIIYARSRRFLGSSAAAEDATQDIFLKILGRLNALPPEPELLPWLHRITTNHCLNLLRNARRQATPVETIPDSGENEFEEEFVTRDFAQALLARLPEELRAPARLYHGEGNTQSTVAEILGVSRRTIVTRLSQFADEVMSFQQSVEAC